MGECCGNNSGMVKPQDLPIYPSKEAQTVAEKSAQEEKGAVMEAMGVVRTAINDGYRGAQGAYGQVEHIIETGKAHSQGNLF